MKTRPSKIVIGASQNPNNLEWLHKFLGSPMVKGHEEIVILNLITEREKKHLPLDIQKSDDSDQIIDYCQQNILKNINPTLKNVSVKCRYSSNVCIDFVDYVNEESPELVVTHGIANSDGSDFISIGGLNRYLSEKLTPSLLISKE